MTHNELCLVTIVRTVVVGCPTNALWFLLLSPHFADMQRLSLIVRQTLLVLLFTRLLAGLQPACCPQTPSHTIPYNEFIFVWSRHSLMLSFSEQPIGAEHFFLELIHFSLKDKYRSKSTRAHKRYERDLTLIYIHCLTAWPYTEAIDTTIALRRGPAYATSATLNGCAFCWRASLYGCAISSNVSWYVWFSYMRSSCLCVLLP